MSNTIFLYLKRFVAIGSKAAMETLVIPAGGLGLRIKKRFRFIPKAMVPIAGKPLIDHQIAWAKANGFSDIIVLAGWRAEVIAEHLQLDPNVRIIMDHRLVGTAGTVLRAVLDGRIPPEFALLYGDLMIDAPFKPFLDYHGRLWADISLFVHPSNHPKDSDLVERNADGWITRLYRDANATAGLSSAGLHIINRKALNPYRLLKFPLDFGKDLLPQMLKDKARIAGYIGKGYIKDIGTPERYDEVCADFAAKTS